MRTSTRSCRLRRKRWTDGAFGKPVVKTSTRYPALGKTTYPVQTKVAFYRIRPLYRMPDTEYWGSLRVLLRRRLEGSALELLQCARPVLFEQARHRSIREQAPSCLTARTVVRLVVAVPDTLDRTATLSTRLAVTAPDRHAPTERGQ